MNYIVRSIIGMATLAIITSLNINLNAAPSVGGGTKSGVGYNPPDSSQIGRASEGNLAAPVLEIYPLQSVRDTSPSFQPAIIAGMLAIHNGNPVTLTNIPTSPLETSYLTNGAAVPWYSHVFSQGDPMFAGELNPEGLLANEHGYTITAIGRFLAQAGKKINLNMLTQTVWDSSDIGEGTVAGHGSLYDVRNYSNLAYTPLARGYNGGVLIDSGSGNQVADEIFVAFWNFPYNGGGTQQGLDEVEAYITNQTNFTLTFTIEAGGVSVTRTMETRPAWVPPVLMVTREGDSVTLGVSGSAGVLETAEALGGPWRSLMNVDAQTAYTLTGLGPVQFFRVRQN